MKELIRVTPHQIGKHTIPTCDARELHHFLEVGRDFSNWIKGRIDQLGYREGRDFVVITGSAILANGEFNPKPAIDYTLSLDTAKELAIVEKNGKGRLIRNYFINCERIVLEQMPRLAAAALAANPTWKKIIHYKGLGLHNKEISLLIGVGKDHVRKQLRRLEGCGLLQAPANLATRQACGKHLRHQGQSLLPGLEVRA